MALFSLPLKSFSQSARQPVPPAVFVLGEYENEVEKLSGNYITLLQACNNDLNAAFGKLQSMIAELEAYANITGFNLKDVKCWMHFFWNKDGKINHIGFYLKPNSRNIDIQSMRSFLASFTMQYRFPLTSNADYSHYFSVSFPWAKAKGKAGGGAKSSSREISTRDPSGK
jgi:hypothetical protein